MALLPRYKADFEVNDENESESDFGDQAEGQYAPEFLQKKKQQLIKAIQDAQISIQKLLQEKQDKITKEQGTSQKKQKTQQQSNKQKDSILRQSESNQICTVPICQSIRWGDNAVFRNIELPPYRVKRWYE